MSAYGSLAFSYDLLTRDVPYGRILKFAQELLAERGVAPRSVLDLACGTGAMSLLLAKAGYEVTGVDMSEEMLTVAMDKTMELEKPPLFIKQKMQRLRMPYGVDWVFSGLDSINYLTDPQDCRETFRRVYHILEPGGVFLFDVNTPGKLKSMDGQVFIDEAEGVFCVWRGAYSQKKRICTYGMDIFTLEGEVWLRDQEEHREYAYEPEELTGYLREAGFRDISLYGDLRRDGPREGEQRIYFLAMKENDHG